MMHHERDGRKKARARLAKSGYANCGGHFAKGGHVHSDEAEDKALIKKEVKPAALKKHLKDGGCADGGMAKPRADRLKRGGKAHKHSKPHTQVNVVVGRSHPQPVPSPVPVPVPAGGPPGAGPMAGPPPGAGPMPPPDGGMPPGGPPMGLKKGGRARKHMADGGALKDILIGQGLKGASSALPLAMAALKKGGRAKSTGPDRHKTSAGNMGRDLKGGMPAGHFKKGGRTGYPIETGSGGAQARLDKAKAYGA